MSSQDDDQDNRPVVLVLMGAVVLAVGLAVGVGIGQVRGHAAKGAAPAAGAAPVAAAAPMAEAATVAAAASAGASGTDAAAAAGGAVAAAGAAPSLSDDASVVVENGVVKFYFASGKAELAPGALAALGDAIAAAKAGKRLVLSGYHDATGDPARNAELAKQRAFAVRDALKAAGVAESSLDLQKPTQTQGTGGNAEARRVEVTIGG
jgi:outer membrane protein OmpA-like peptidoglycan-associated protein